MKEKRIVRLKCLTLLILLISQQLTGKTIDSRIVSSIKWCSHDMIIPIIDDFISDKYIQVVLNLEYKEWNFITGCANRNNLSVEELIDKCVYEVYYYYYRDLIDINFLKTWF